MDKIQEHAKQFEVEWLRQIPQKWHGSFKEEYYALLRKVAEECLEAICEEEDYVAIGRIKRDFAWLLEANDGH